MITSDARYFTRSVLARAAGVSVDSIRGNKRIEALRGPDGRYDTQHPEILAYIEGKRKFVAPKRAQQDLARSVLPENYSDPQAVTENEHEKEKLELTRQRRIKEQLKNLELMRETVPTALLVTWMSAFATGLRNNVLTAGTRIARGNKELQERCDTELARSIRAVLSHAATEVKSFAAGLSDEMQSAVDALNAEIREREGRAVRTTGKKATKKTAKKAAVKP